VQETTRITHAINLNSLTGILSPENIICSGRIVHYSTHQVTDGSRWY
jgi:hypothetical protein